MTSTKRLVLLILIITVITAGQAQKKNASVLKNANCSDGSGKELTRCGRQLTAHSGTVSCGCVAQCVACARTQDYVNASSSLSWGIPVNGHDCLFEVTGEAVGGPTNTSVFAATLVTGGFTVQGFRRSRMEDDCFLGLIASDPPIAGFCI